MVSKSQPFKIDELIELIHPRDGHEKIIAMVEAYFDESGIHDGAQVCVIAGYFGRQNAWRKIESGWRTILRKYNLELEDFHAKDLIKSQNHQSMLRELATCITKYDIFAISAGVIVSDFKEMDQGHRKWFTGDAGRSGGTGAPSKPYFVPFQLCLQKVTDYTPAGAKAHFFFGLDRTFSGYATELFSQIKDSGYTVNWQTKKRLGNIAFPSAKETPQLQVADLFVHLTYLHFTERNKEKNWEVNVTSGSLLHLCLAKTRSKMDHVFQNNECFYLTIEKAKTILEKHKAKAAPNFLH